MNIKQSCDHLNSLADTFLQKGVQDKSLISTWYILLDSNLAYLWIEKNNDLIQT